MTITELSKQMGIARTALSEMFSGKRAIGAKTAKKIAVYLGQEDWRRLVEIPAPELRRLLLNTQETIKVSEGDQP